MEQNLYEREISSYCHYFPLLQQIRTEAGLSSTDIPLNVPEIYYSILDQQGNEDGGNVTVLVMEELKSQGLFRKIHFINNMTETVEFGS